MDFEDLKRAYDEKRSLYRGAAYLHVSEIFDELKAKYEEEYLASAKARKKTEAEGTPEAGQSWRAFKGNNFEKLILYILETEVESLGLKCISGGELERRSLSKELNRIRRNLVVHYGNYDILPDVDLVIHQPKTLRANGCNIFLCS